MSASLIEHLDAEIADLEHQLGALRQARSVLVGKAPGPAAGRFLGGAAADLPEDRGYRSDISAGWMA